MREFDAIVIGAGSGLDIASAYASKGKDVAVIEPGPMGGTCLNRGCIPSKMLIHRADIVETIEESEKFHIDSEVNDIDFQGLIMEVNREVAEDSDSIEDAIRNSDQHTLYKTEAEFVDEKTVDVDGEKITADKIFIAAGTRPLVPPVPGLQEVDYLTSREALQLEDQPEHMIIIGGGYISAELAHFYDKMGTEVTIIEMTDNLVGREDQDIYQKYTELAKEKYNVELGLKASEVEKAGNGVRVKAEDKEGNTHSFAGDELLVAAGRKPNTDKLNLEEAGYELDDRGFVETNNYLETNIDGVYALGDIAGNFMFKHSANLEAEYALKSSMGQEHEVDYTAMPHAIFSSPRIAGVGKTEQQLEDEGADYVSATYQYSDTGRGMAMKEKDGFVKVLASHEGEILGCHILGPEAPTMIHEVLVAMKAGTGNVKDIQDTIHIHPALNEVVQRAFKQI